MKLNTFIFFDQGSRRVVNIIGSQASGKSALMYNIAINALQNERKIIFVLFDEQPITIIDRLQKMSNLELYRIHDNLILVDGYSSIIGNTSKEKYSINSRDLSDISIGISKALQNKPEMVFFDPFSSLSIHHDEQSLIKTYQIILAKLRESVKCAYITFESGIHSEGFYNTIRYLADINLVMKIEETKSGESERYIHIHSAKGMTVDNKWCHFTIEKNGLLNFVTQTGILKESILQKEITKKILEK